jgi:hypothetical protein
MWTLYEAYDGDTHVLELCLISEPVRPPQHPKLGAYTRLEAFDELADAQRFVDGYTKAVGGRKDRIVRSVECGNHRLNGCRGPGQPCYLGLDDFHCKRREGQT